MSSERSFKRRRSVSPTAATTSPNDQSRYCRMKLDEQGSDKLPTANDNRPRGSRSQQKPGVLRPGRTMSKNPFLPRPKPTRPVLCSAKFTPYRFPKLDPFFLGQPCNTNGILSQQLPIVVQYIEPVFTPCAASRLFLDKDSAKRPRSLIEHNVASATTTNPPVPHGKDQHHAITPSEATSGLVVSKGQTGSSPDTSTTEAVHLSELCFLHDSNVD